MVNRPAPKSDESGTGRDESGATGTKRANRGTNPPREVPPTTPSAPWGRRRRPLASASRPREPRRPGPRARRPSGVSDPAYRFPAASPLRSFSVARHSDGGVRDLSAHRPRRAARASRSGNTTGPSALRRPAQREITSAESGSVNERGDGGRARSTRTPDRRGPSPRSKVRARPPGSGDSKDP